MSSPPSKQNAEEPHQAVLARVKQAILEDDRSGALALLHILLTDGPETAATLTPVLAQALIATARTERDADDQRARRSFDEAYAARTQICRLLRSAPLDSDDLATIRAALEDRDRQLNHELQLRLADHRDGSTPESLRLGVGWLERYWVARRWGPYLRARFRQDDGRKRMKYIGKVSD